MTFSHRQNLICLMVVPTMLCGCALFAPKDSDALPFSLKKPAFSEENSASPQLPVKRVARMQVATLASRPSDARLRNLIWEELDESGAMKPEDRLRLNRSGLRVGVSGSALPWALNGLLQGNQREASELPRTFGTAIAILEGSSSRVELPAKDEVLPVPPDELSGLMEGGELQNASFAFKVEPIEYTDGWVLLRMTPELRYGEISSRFSFSAEGGSYEQRQKHHPLYDQQFQLKLHVGESVVIGYQENEGWTVGKMLMQSEQLTNVFENLVVLQLNDVETIQGQMTVDRHRTTF